MRGLQPLREFREGHHQGHKLLRAISGNEPNHHFARVRKMIAVGKGEVIQGFDFLEAIP
jgi:hypothetical protein